MIEPITEGLYWVAIYWVRGANSSRSRFRNEVSDPPVAGWSRAFVIDPDKTSKFVTLFCPNSFESYQVSRKSAEYQSIKEAKFRRGWMEMHLPDQWAAVSRYGWSRAFDVATMLFRALEIPVPTISTANVPQADAKPRGGKPVAETLLKPVKPKGRRGEVLAFFLGEVSRSVREAMVEFSVTRSNLLSQLYMLNKEHGIGYALVGDGVEITLPDGVESPFKQD